MMGEVCELRVCVSSGGVMSALARDSKVVAVEPESRLASTSGPSWGELLV